MVSATLAYPLPAAQEKANAFYAAFVISLVLVSLPIKNFAYVVPPVYLLFLACRGNGAPLFRVIGIVVVALLVSTFALLFDSDGMRVNAPGTLFAVLTYLPIFIVASHPQILSLSDEVVERLQTTCAWFVMIQSLIGILQFAASGNPDAVCGTFGLLDFRYARITINQVYFTFNLFVMVLFMFLDAKRRLIQIAIGIGLVACVLAQSGHQTFFFVGSLAAFGLTRITRPKIVLASLLVCAAVMGLVQYFYPETFELASRWRDKMLDDRSPKRMVVEASWDVMRDSKNMLIGTGLGQFSSRAALITSNEYLSTKLPEPLVGKSTYFVRYIKPANDRFEKHGEGSALSKPYCSALSICVETGLVGSLLVVILLVSHLFRNRRLTRNQQPWISLCGMLANVGLLFFVLCCTIENYAEFPQAIFLPVLLYVVAISKARTLEGEQSNFLATRDQQESTPREPHRGERVGLHDLGLETVR